ncbi:MAG: hypothetical protein, partial [Olavius algarvensis Delta 4 endosymbiont]
CGACCAGKNRKPLLAPRPRITRCHARRAPRFLGSRVSLVPSNY